MGHLCICKIVKILSLWVINKFICKHLPGENLASYVVRFASSGLYYINTLWIIFNVIKDKCKFEYTNQSMVTKK